MRTSHCIVCIGWLLLTLIPGFSHASPYPSGPATRSALGTEHTTVFRKLARATSHSKELGVADIPACGIKCLVEHVPKSGCSITDTLCVCTNAKLTDQLSACMVANCTMAENLGTARVNADMCALSFESQRSSVIAYSIGAYSVAVTLVGLRVVGKMVSTGLAWNDAPIVIAVLLSAVPIACVLAMAKIGFGEHLWNLEDDTFLPILRYFYVAWATSVAILGLIKLSLIMFYLDVFPTRSFKIAGYIVFWYIAVNTIIMFLMRIFACAPVSAFWNRDLKGKCMNVQMLGYAHSISAIAQDVIIVVLPMYYLRKLQMKWTRKLAVAVMFLIGSFGCITTIVRLRALLKFKISFDPTWDYVPIVIWTELEITAAFACVSLPAIRVLFVKMIPKRLKGWGSEISHSSGHQTPRQVKSMKCSSKRNWQEGETWINLASTELPGEKQAKGRIGLLPSAETSISHLKAAETRSTCASKQMGTSTTISGAGATTKLSLLKAPVSVMSRFSNHK